MDTFTREEAARLLDAIEVDDGRCDAAPGPGCGATLPLEPNLRLITEALELAEHRGAARALLGEAQGFVHDAHKIGETADRVRDPASATSHGTYWLSRAANHLLSRAREHEKAAGIYPPVGDQTGDQS
jgi:hypothetical protein